MHYTKLQQPFTYIPCSIFVIFIYFFISTILHLSPIPLSVEPFPLSCDGVGAHLGGCNGAVTCRLPLHHPPQGQRRRVMPKVVLLFSTPCSAAYIYAVLNHHHHHHPTTYLYFDTEKKGPKPERWLQKGKAGLERRPKQWNCIGW